MTSTPTKPSTNLPASSHQRDSPLLRRVSSGVHPIPSGCTYHAFLTHTWQKDEENRPTHDRVARVAAGLKARGIHSWFDGERMQDDVVDQMIKGIHDSAVFVVFITKKYIDKVGSGNDADNCRKEFTYADRKKTAKMMMPVPMERCVSNPTSWVGPVGMSLGGLLYEASFCDDEEATFAKNLDNLAQQILRKCRESEGSEGGEATVSATATLTAVAAVPMATATSASLPDEVATWLAQLDIDASPQLVGAFDALGFKRMDDFADLEEEDIATLEAAMKRLEVKRFRRDRQSREEAKKVAREAAAREDRLRQEAVERSRKEAAAAREKAVAREKSAKEKVAREKAAREKVEREKAAAARAKALVARINAAKEENDCRGVVDAVREGASSALVAEKGCVRS